MFYSDDPAADAERYMAHLDEKLKRRPVCECCGHHIQDDSAVLYRGEWICFRCVYSLVEEIEVDE